MHNAYLFSGKQIFSVLSPRHDFPEKHICRKMLRRIPFKVRAILAKIIY